MRRSATVCLLSTLALGCAGGSEEEPEQPQQGIVSSSRQELLNSINGLRTINGLSTLNGLRTLNGLTTLNGLKTLNGLMTINGLKTLNGLTAVKGLSVDCTGGTPGVTCTGSPDGLLSATTGLMSSDDGMATAKYLVRCALPATDKLTIKDYTGGFVTLQGEIGFAPEWATGQCDGGCQEKVSACLMALTNTSGAHVEIGMSAPFVVGTGTDDGHPLQEAAYYGNIFVSPPQAFYAEGAAFQGAVLGRTVVGGIANRSCASWRDAQVTCPYGDTGTIAAAPRDVDRSVSSRCSTTSDGTATSCTSGTGTSQQSWAYPITTYRALDAFNALRQAALPLTGPNAAPLIGGTIVTLAPAYGNQMCVRHWAFRGRVDSCASMTGYWAQDASFTVRTGLADAGTVSFESVNYPGYFLRYDGTGIVVAQTSLTDAVQKANASFLPIVGLAGEFTSFAVYSNPRLLLRVSGSDVVAAAFDGTDAFRRDATFAVQAPLASLLTSYTQPTNVAATASLATSYVSNWETLSAVKDGVTPSSSSDHSAGAYGNWRGTDAYAQADWVSFTWPTAKVISGFEIYWWNDGAGISSPNSAVLEYLDDAGQWRAAGEIGTQLDQFNRVMVSPAVVTKSMRIKMMSVQATGILEARLWGLEYRNLAQSAKLSTSYVSSWETLAAVADGKTPASSSDHSSGAYGNWAGTSAYGATNSVTFTWPTAQNVSAFDVYWWQDGAGIALPSSAWVEYQDSATLAWRSVGQIGRLPDVYNHLDINAKALALRVSMVGPLATGILEGRILGQ